MNLLNFDSRLCERVRGQLDAYLSNELLVETASEVVKHLERCEACSRELDSRTRLREALRRAVASKVPPEHLQQAVHQRLRKLQPGYFGVSRNWALALAALIVVILVGAVGRQWLRQRQERRLISSILTLGVVDHLHCAIKWHNYPEVARTREQLLKRLGPEYAELLPVVEEKLPGFQVLEAHICSVPGSPRKYVHFIARGHGTILSMILTRRGHESLPTGRLLVAAAPGGVDLYKARLGGMSVAGFETNEYFGFVVSDLGQDEMVHLAAALAPALRKALDAGARTENSPALKGKGGVLTPPEKTLSI